MIVVVDYGSGNMKSVMNALDALLVDYMISDNVEDIKQADKIILPGVGHFGHAMNTLKEKNLIVPIKEAIKEGKPYLGICLGLQLLFESSEEAPGVNGLGILKGSVIRFKGKMKIPHMGWNSIEKKKEHSFLKDISNGTYLYFVHSYFVVPQEKEITLTTTDYGKSFVSAIATENIFACQFHPEKSGQLGISLLRRFCEE